MTKSSNNIRSFSAIIIIIMFFIQCGEKNEKELFYYFVSLNEKSSVENYIIRRISWKDKIRYEEIFVYDAEGKHKRTYSDCFRIESGGLSKKIIHDKDIKFLPYLTIDSKDRIDFIYENEKTNNIASSAITFIGLEDIHVSSKHYKSSYKFLKSIGKNNPVVSEIYYDSDFIPILEEFLDGERPYYKVIRSDTTFKFLIPR